MAQQGLLDRWVEKLSSDSQSRDEAIKELVTLLNEDLRDELVLAMELEAEADHLIYEHLAKEIRGIAKKKRELVKTIEKLITDLGGNVDKEELENYVAEPNGHFGEILEMETGLGGRFIEQVNLAEDAGLHEAAGVLINLKEKNHSHLETIESVIMKINTSL
jgi:hypothetical protein